jgi:hypothetical protein
MNVRPPEVTDPEERKKILKELFESFDRNPIPDSAPARFIRDDLYERDDRG